MGEMNRRRWLESMGIIAVGSALPKPDFSGQLKSPEGSGKMRLDVSEFQPKSMLHAPETKVSRSKYPVIDIHTHLSIRAKSVHGVGIGEKMEFLATPESVLPVMDLRQKGSKKPCKDFSSRIRIVFLLLQNPHGTIPINRITASFKLMKSSTLTKPAHAG